MPTTASPDIFDDVASPSSASSTDIFDQVSGGEPEKPKTYLPEVNKAVASVPKPDSPLNYAVPGNDVTGAVTGFFPEKAPQSARMGSPEPPRAQLPATPPLEAVKATLEATPPQSETPLLPGAATEVSAAQHLATPGKRWQGATEAVQGAGEAVTPFMGPAATEMAAVPELAPALKFATGLGVGIGGQPLAEKGAEKLGASPEQQQFWGELAFWAPQIAGLLASQVKGGVDVTPEGTRASISTPGGKVGAGVAVTPEGVTVRGKVGPFEGSKTFSRGPQAGPTLEPPTIEGQPPAAPGPPPPSDDPAITSMANAHQAQDTAAKQAAGIPEPPPPTILDQPNAPPELKENRIAPESITRMASFVAGLPDAQRAQAVQEAHQTLTAALTEMGKRGPVSMPDGTLALVKDPKSAEKLAISIINDAVKAHDKVSASLSGEGERGKQTGAVSPKEAASGDIFDQAAQNPTATEKPSPAGQESQQPLKKGDTATLARDIDINGKTLAKGTPVTLTYVHPNGLLARATTEDGTKISRGVGAFTKGVESKGAPAAEKPASSVPVPLEQNGAEGGTLRGASQGNDEQLPSGVSEGRPSGDNKPQRAEETPKSVTPAAEPEHPNLDLGEHAAHTEMVPTKTVSEYGKDVEMLPVEELEKLATHDRRKEPFGSDMDELKADIQKNGIKEPLELGYNHAEKKAVIWDGNHRLGVARELNLRELPVRVVATDFPTAQYGKTVSGYTGEGKVPEHLRPSDIGVGARPVKTEESKGANVAERPPVATVAAKPEPTSSERQRQQIGLPPSPGKVGEMNVRDLKVAPNKFQYKLSTDAEGVGSLLKETKVFNPDLAGVISVWHDPTDRKTYVVNGHHRYELAKRTGQKTVTVRHIVAKDAVTARAIGALQNIAEGRGTAIDAAKFFRDSGLDPEQLKEKGISLGEKTASDGLAMSKLDPAIFQKVVSGDLRQGTAIAIGEGTSDPAEQSAILKQIERKERKGQRVSDDRIREFIRLAQGEKKVEETTDLFGTQQIERSLLWEKSEISEYIQQQLKKDKKLFGFVAKEGRAEELARAGNKIDVEKSKEISTGAAQAEEVYNKLSARGGPIASILDEAARKLADGESAGEVKSDAYQRIRAEVSQTLQGSTGTSAERSKGAPEAPEAKGQEASIDLFSGAAPYKAPVFYSKAARVAFEKLPSSMSGDSALATLKNAGVKADEIKWIGLDDLLAGKAKVSKQDVLSHIMRNMVQIKEVTHGQRSPEQQRRIDEAREKATQAQYHFYAVADREVGIQRDSLAETVEEETRRIRGNPEAAVTKAVRDFFARPHRKVMDTIAKEMGYGGWTSGLTEKQQQEVIAAFDAQPDTLPSEQPSKELLEAARDYASADRNLRDARQPNQTPTKYESYTLPGEKQNYTELLLTLPEKVNFQTYEDWLKSEGIREQTPANYDRYRREVRSGPTASFKSSHFDEPNILAHVRFDDRTDADGKHVLFVEEVQSDWHQKGKKQGYIQPVNSSKWTAEKVMHGKEAEPYNEWIVKQPWFISGALSDKASPRAHELYDEYKGRVESWRTKSFIVRDENAKQLGERYADSAQEAIQQQAGMEEGARNRNKVPDAPFKSDWHELAMKRMLRAAAENGYDKLAWVTGEQTADRYDLGKHIDTLRYERDPFTNSYMLHAEKDGRELLAKDDVPASKLEEYVGKEVAQRIINNEGQKPDSDEAKDAPLARYLTGLQLKVGGEWAKNLYDRAIPNFISKVGKKWGVKASTTTIDQQPTHVEQDENDGKYYVVMEHTGTQRAFDTEPEAQEYAEEMAQGGEKVHSIDVTPEMKKSLVEDGQPLFSSFFPSFPPSVAKDIQFSSVQTKDRVAPYLRVNDAAMQAVSRSLGINFLGVNLDRGSVGKVSAALRTAADTAEMNGSDKKAIRQLNGFADALDKALDESPKQGVNLVRQGEDETRTAHEELLHSAQRQAGEGNLIQGVPWKQSLAEPGMARMAAERIVPQLKRARVQLHPAVIVAEGLVDIMRGDASTDLTPTEAFQSAEKYFEAALSQHGIEHLQDFQAVQDYIAEQEEALGVAHDREQYAVRAAGEAALARVLSRATGGAVQPSGTELPPTANQSEEATSTGSGGTSLSPQDNAGLGRKRPASTAKEPLFSTQPIGLTDEELEQWAKSKGFRYEPAGEQLGMFGGNDQLLRVFRQGPRGREQRGLVYQNQLDRLQETQATAPTEPFSLTGGEEREEQPRLFGAGDLGEIIGNPQGEKPKLPTAPGEEKNDFSLFSSDRGEADLSKLGKDVRESAEAVQGYLKSVREYTRIARDLQRGLETLDSQKQADILRAKQTMEDIKLPHADDEKLYHHLEDPEHVDLTPKQDEILDNVILPIADQNNDLFTELTNGGVPVENYVHRVVKGKGGVLDRIAQGVKGVGQKASLSKSAPQTKHRTYMALEKSAERGQGNVFTRPGDRVVVSIKGGQVTAWRNGQPENLGGISNTEEGKAFKDKDGNLWTLQQATTKEIEQHTETRYYHSALASTLVSNIQLGSAVRAMRFLNEFKKSEDFRESAFDLKTKGNPPKGWQTTKLQQFAGYAFEPRTAEVLDWYADRSRQGNMGALDQIGKFMRVAMLLNPIMHPMNVAASWAMERGATGFLMPTNYRNAWKAGNKAVKAVLSQNQDFLDALDAGAPLQSHREAIKDITKLFFDQLAEGLGKQEPWAVKVAKSLGIEHGNLLNILHKFSSTVAWASNDIFFLQSAYEHQAAGMSLQDALKETGRVIPEYRVPTRILDSQLLSKLMTNRWATIFGAYHYSLLKSFGEVAKSALGAGGGGQPPTGKGRQFGTGAEGSGFNGRTRAQEIAKGWDRLALLALVTMALYPILDDLLKKATGDKHAAAKRFGPFALIDAIAAAAHRQQSVSTTAQRIVTPAPQTKAAAELLMDREFYSGRHIYDPHADWKTQAQEVGRYLVGEMGQIGQVEKAQTTEQKRKLAWQQVGVSFRKTRAEKIAADIAAEKSGKQAEDPEDEKNRVLRREILEQLRKGNQKPLEDAKTAGEITHKQIKSLEHRAHLTPLQDTVHGFTYSEARSVYEAADADEKKELDPIMRQKRVNMLKAGRGKELTTSNP